MHRIRSAISQKFSQYAKNINSYQHIEVPPKKVLKTSSYPIVHWSLETDVEGYGQLKKWLPFEKFHNDDILRSARLLPAELHGATILTKLELEVEPQAFMEDVLEDSVRRHPLPFPGASETRLVFEFSSPNIAKPFHVGHLRSTIIGNVLANMHQYLGYTVTKLNYLGDWGTQFGMLQVGVELMGLTEKELRDRPIKCLYEAYVSANEAARNDRTVTEKARQYFTEMETGNNAQCVRQWLSYRNYTIKELNTTYDRLGVRFDEYEWESQYSQKQIERVLNRMWKAGLIVSEPDGKQCVVVDGRRIPIIKSDGTTLYLTRDIAALLDRYERHEFEKIYYVVENGQSDHFNALFKTMAALEPKLPMERMQHVKFGRIHGMSTRKGKAIFLRDVLDEARDIMAEKQRKSPTTKVDVTWDSSARPENVADILGLSAVIINDLKLRRQKDYDFDWHKILQVSGDTGIKMQYTHCRLCNLLDNARHIRVNGLEMDHQYLTEPEAKDLICEIARFDHSLWLAKEQLEPCILVSYTFGLCNVISRAIKHLHVKNEDCRVTQQHRILLFQAARATLFKCMSILGLKPLTKM